MTQSKIPSHDPVAVLREALDKLIDIAGTCDSWQSFPRKALEEANAALIATERAATQPAGQAGVRKARELLPKLHSMFNRMRNPSNIRIKCEEDSRTVGDASELCRTIINAYAAPISEDTGENTETRSYQIAAKFRKRGIQPAAPSVTEGDALAVSLLPLPDPEGHAEGEDWFTAEQTTAYAHVNMLADRAARAQASVESIGEDKEFKHILHAVWKSGSFNYGKRNTKEQQELIDFIDRWASSRATQPEAAARVADDEVVGMPDMSDDMLTQEQMKRHVQERMAERANNPIQEDDPQLYACDFLLNAAQEFLSSCHQVGQYGAVQWLSGTDGELLIYTRGEYREQLMSNIHMLPNKKQRDIAPTKLASEYSIGLLKEALAWIENSSEPAPSLCGDIRKSLGLPTAPAAPDSARETMTDTERLDWIEQRIKEAAAVWLCPSGPDLRYVQVHDGECQNYPTVEGIREAIDAAILATKGKA